MSSFFEKMYFHQVQEKRKLIRYFRIVTFIYKYKKIDIFYFKSYLLLLIISIFNFLILLFIKNKIHSLKNNPCVQKF